MGNFYTDNAPLKGSFSPVLSMKRMKGRITSSPVARRGKLPFNRYDSYKFERDFDYSNNNLDLPSYDSFSHREREGFNRSDNLALSNGHLFDIPSYLRSTDSRRYAETPRRSTFTDRRLDFGERKYDPLPRHSLLDQRSDLRDNKGPILDRRSDYLPDLRTDFLDRKIDLPERCSDYLQDRRSDYLLDRKNDLLDRGSDYLPDRRNISTLALHSDEFLRREPSDLFLNSSPKFKPYSSKLVNGVGYDRPVGESERIIDDKYKTVYVDSPSVPESLGRRRRTEGVSSKASRSIMDDRREFDNKLRRNTLDIDELFERIKKQKRQIMALSETLY